MEILPTLLGGIGLGSLLLALLQSWLSKRKSDEDRIFTERREAYLGLLDSWRRQNMEGLTQETRQDVGHWITRCELVGSERLRKSLEQWHATDLGSAERNTAGQALQQAMRDDLIPSRLQ